MYDEFEKAMTGRRPRKGLSPLGWILLTFGFMVAVGIVGVGFVAYQVVERVQDVKHDLGMAPDLAAARVASRIASAPELISMDPERGVTLLSDLDGRGDGKELLKAFLDAGADAPPVPGAPQPPTPGQVAVDGAEGTVRIRTGEDDVRFDFRGGDDRAFLSIDSDQGMVRFELEEGANGPRIQVRTDDRELDIVFGADAERAPMWVSRLEDVPGSQQPVISLLSGAGRLGAVAWEADEAPADVLASWQDALEGEGYEVRAEHHVRDSGGEHASLWARDEADGRMVFVVAHQDRDRTGVLLGYGEKR